MSETSNTLGRTGSRDVILDVQSLQVCFADQAVVDDVSLQISRGETYVLLGESGSGKSITSTSIMRLLPNSAQITQGQIVLDGVDLLRLPESQMRAVRGGKIGMIFQEPQTSLNPVMTIGDQIAESVQWHQKLTGQALRERVIALLEAVGIVNPEQRYDEYPHQFSGGMKQRVMIAIALAGEPELLIADEPTTALDVTIQAQVLDLLNALKERLNMAMLFITHDLGVAAKMADKIGVMRSGKLLEQGCAADFFKGPQHAYSQELFAALPSWEKREIADRLHPVQSDDSIILEVHDLDVHFPIKRGFFKRTVGHVRAVNCISMQLKAGRTIAMVGESGSGKTTFGKGILQLVKPTAGRVLFQGEELTQLSSKAMRARRSEIQIVFQDPYSSMNPRMIVGDIIEEGMIAQGVGGSKNQRVARVEALLEEVGLEASHRLRYPHEFSGGQRQRICIARALAVEPRLIICDEPTSALDVSVQAQILELLKRLQSQMGLTYLFITHNLAVVEYIAHEVAVMYQGEIVEYGSVEQVMRDPQHTYTQQLLAAVPRLVSESS